MFRLLTHIYRNSQLGLIRTHNLFKPHLSLPNYKLFAGEVRKLTCLHALLLKATEFQLGNLDLILDWVKNVFSILCYFKRTIYVSSGKAQPMTLKNV